MSDGRGPLPDQLGVGIGGIDPAFVREVDRITDDLAGAFAIAANDDEWDYYQSEKEALLTPSRGRGQRRDLRWCNEGSTRISVGFGRTFQGEWLADRDAPPRRSATQHPPVVVKFQPSLRAHARSEADDPPGGVPYTHPRPSGAGNPYAARVWKTAVGRGDTDLFAPLAGVAADSAWLIQWGGIPIYQSPPGNADRPEHGTQDYLIDGKSGAWAEAFRERFRARGWAGHDIGHGNVGLLPDGDTVWLDYGGHVEAETDGA